MTARLVSHLIVSALLRRAQADGGHAAVLAKGDAEAGGIIVILASRGQPMRVLEHGHDLDGHAVWRENVGQGIANERKISEMVESRRRTDRDLWVVELDVADIERFAAGMTGAA